MENLSLIISDIYNIKAYKEILEKNKSDLDNKIKSLENDLSAKENILLTMLNENDINEYLCEDSNLVAARFSKSSSNYLDEKSILDILKSKYNGNFINTKITESIDKKSLKKQIKVDKDLENDLKDFMEAKTTQYVVVTSKINYDKMKEHINESKKVNQTE